MKTWMSLLLYLTLFMSGLSSWASNGGGGGFGGGGDKPVPIEQTQYCVEHPFDNICTAQPTAENEACYQVYPTFGMAQEMCPDTPVRVSLTYSQGYMCQCGIHP